MALSNLSLFGGAFFTPVIVGKMTSTLGWQWTFYFCAIFTGALLPLLFFFVPETTFNRADYLNTDSTRLTEREHYKTAPEASVADMHHTPQHNRGLVFGLGLFNGRHTDESYFKLLLRPFPLFFHPGVLWACLIQGTLIGWTVLIGIVLAAIMLGPPLFFNEVQTGYMYTGAFIGALLGFILAGLISDPCIKLLTRWNKGVYEPEFRLVLVIPQLIFGCAGLYGFGITANNTTKYGWVRLPSPPPPYTIILPPFLDPTNDSQFWPDFFFSLEVIGMVLGAVASALYLVDAHRDMAVEAFTCLLVFKNIFSFGLTFSGYDWLVQGGVKPVFTIIASVQVGVCCLTFFMYVFGKWNRAFFARHDLLAAMRLK